MEFRALRADEIECRVGQIAKNGSGLSLLLYKNARTDADILDEVLGIEDWQCEYDVINGQLFCKVLVWSERHGQWIAKQDVGSPSNMEAEKGRASDAFKRACFKLGIGRELYTAPRIWVYAQNRDGSTNCEIRQGNNGRFQCYDSFSVERIDIRDHEILYVSIRNDRTGRTVFVWAKPENQTEEVRQANAPTRDQLAEISELVQELADGKGVESAKVIEGLMGSNAMKAAGVTDGEIRTARQAVTAIGQLRAWTKSGERNA